MAHNNSLNVKLFNSQLNKLKSVMKNETGVTLRSSSNIVGKSNDETNFLHTLLLTDRQIPKLCKALVNNSSVNIKLSKTQLSKIAKSGFCDVFLRPLLENVLPLMKSVLKQSAKSVLIPLGLTAAVSATDPCIHKKNLDQE